MKAGTRETAAALTGFTVGVTAARRREELTALLRRRGARVVEAPALRIVPLENDAELRAATERCLAAPLDYVVATTGVGWRGWMSAAEGWGHGAALTAACRAAQVLSRGPKATGAVRASGITEAYAPASEAVDELRDHLLAQELTGRRIAVQEHGTPLPGLVAALRERGAEVVEVPVYRWAPPADPEPARRLAESTARGEVHALLFTSAPAIASFLDEAAAVGRYDGVLERLRRDVLPLCVGPVCARPLLDAGVEPVWPERGRLGAMVHLLTAILPGRDSRVIPAGGRRLLLQGNALLLGDTAGTTGAEEAVWLTPMSAGVLRVLAERPGWVVSRRELLRRAWSGQEADEHAVEAAVTRLRRALGPHAGLVRTVPKRGYRLETDR
ncbi:MULTISPECIES: uroporphyrinogen-III synthase [unclassified Streptomyces]|uniref:uroporphyrinogen-III synthase n=1 Tax=unclassified Streptomyces TaxID=2593676 RepID=UPI001EE4E199|nr:MULTISPECIES: uroporphyrinogen-III synthase [unclassified Streptomyces]MCG5117413.1 uroporphyrinogen-III synthase [Streptomyces sp. T7(2022)]MCK2145096.1 uroporphyrinogen-III synthase [Streptomyces sp. WAC00276]MCQ9704922.1 uroporphyrinogen-III synthase [Streptomyces sp. BSP1]